MDLRFWRRRRKPDAIMAEMHAGAVRELDQVIREATGGRAVLTWDDQEVVQGQPIPGFSQGQPKPDDLPRHTYGGNKTIHHTGTIDIQVDEDTGEVLAVWFRCLNLPFKVSSLPRREGDGYPVNPRTYVERITYVEES